MSDLDFDPSGLTALVLDESAFQRAISIDQLRAIGLRTVWGATSAADAWALLRLHNPDVVLLEWLNGNHDTLAFIKRVRTSDESPNRTVSLFMLSARSVWAEVDAARNAGVDGYLRKPISALALGQRVRQVVLRPHPFVMTATYVGPCRRRIDDAYYPGPFRRESDTATARAMEQEEVELRSELARACAAALEASVQRLVVSERSSVADALSAVSALARAGEQINDVSLTMGAREMARYIEASVTMNQLDLEIVRLHAEALQQLANLPFSFKRERRRVAQSLQRMVTKKLNQAARSR